MAADKYIFAQLLQKVFAYDQQSNICASSQKSTWLQTNICAAFQKSIWLQTNIYAAFQESILLQTNICAGSQESICLPNKYQKIKMYLYRVCRRFIALSCLPLSMCCTFPQRRLESSSYEYLGCYADEDWDNVGDSALVFGFSSRNWMNLEVCPPRRHLSIELQTKL